MSLRYIFISLIAIVWSTSSFALEMTCETRFTQIIESSAGVNKVGVKILKDWIIRIKSKECALKTIAAYPQFNFINKNYPVPRKSDALDLINRANAILVAMHDVLDEKEFYSVFEGKLRENLPQKIDESSMKQFNFNLPLSDRSKNSLFKAANKEVDNIRRYETLCQPNQTRACDQWEDSIRFFAALSYISNDISNQFSLRILATFREQVVEEIKLWDRYFASRKPQLPWEMFTNELLQREIRNSEYFARPPKWDIVLMHPQLVYTDTQGDLAQGDVESTLMWEIVGANFWNDNLLSGISIVTDDLEKADNLGVNLILKNKFSVGYLDDDDGTWYISVDLYDFIESKENSLKEQMEERLNRFSKN